MPEIKRIGIALAAYEPEPESLAKQLSSIQDQTFQEWVCVLSFDSDPSMLRENPALSAFVRDSRFVWVRNPVRLGFKKNFESAIRQVASLGVDAVACSDQDDQWYPGKLAAEAEMLSDLPPLSLVHCDMHVNVRGKRLDGTAWELERRGVENVSVPDLLIRNVVSGTAMLFDSELARRYPVIPDESPFHDQWYALVAAAHGGVHALYQPLYEYFQHEKNVVGVIGFEGVLSVKTGNSLTSILSKSKRGWRESRELARAAERAGVPLPTSVRRLFLERGDLGAGVLVLGLKNLLADPPLARAALIRGTGKLLSTFGKS